MMWIDPKDLNRNRYCLCYIEGPYRSFFDCYFKRIAWRVNVGRKANLGECSIINPTFNGFEETNSYWSEFSFSLLFIGKTLMTRIYGII